MTSRATLGDALPREMTRTSPLASFFRRASTAEKEKVYEAVMEHVTAEQNNLLKKVNRSQGAEGV